jgi:hypothetical protein
MELLIAGQTAWFCFKDTGFPFAFRIASMTLFRLKRLAPNSFSGAGKISAFPAISAADMNDLVEGDFFPRP